MTGLFEDQKHAQGAFDRLVEEAFDSHDVSVLRVDERHREVERVAVEHKSRMPAGITTGIVLGGTVGVAGAVLGGPLGLLGALAGMAFWKGEPDLESELRRGSVFVGVTAEGARADMARRALESAGAKRIFG